VAPGVVETAAQFLAGCGAGAVAADLPEARIAEVPEDRVDLRRLIGDLEDARAVFDRRLAEGLDAAVTRLGTASAGARAADATPFMQGSGR
jgi:hypothetical protein